MIARVPMLRYPITHHGLRLIHVILGTNTSLSANKDATKTSPLHWRLWLWPITTSTLPNQSVVVRGCLQPLKVWSITRDKRYCPSCNPLTNHRHGAPRSEFIILPVLHLFCPPLPGLDGPSLKVCLWLGMWIPLILEDNWIVTGLCILVSTTHKRESVGVAIEWRWRGRPLRKWDNPFFGLLRHSGILTGIGSAILAHGRTARHESG